MRDILDSDCSRFVEIFKPVAIRIAPIKRGGAVAVFVDFGEVNPFGFEALVGGIDFGAIAKDKPEMGTRLLIVGT